MTDQQINLAIAEACGWKRESVWDDIGNGRHAYVHTSGAIKYLSDLPSYCTDLNEMHEAEKVIISKSLIAEYNDELCKAVEKAYPATPPWSFLATAHQRASAFLLTLGLWRG